MSGIIIIPVFIFYTLVTFFIIKLIFKFFKKEVSNILLLIIVILLPFWDLFVQKGIKTYYELFLLEPIVYEMPERDKDGKIESLGLSVIKFIPKNKLSFNEMRVIENTYLIKKLKKNVKNYYETRIYDRLNRNNQSILKIYLNDNLKFNFVDNQTAKYQLVKYNFTYNLLGFVKTQSYKIIDSKKNIVLAEVFNLHFTTKYAYFRNNILLMVSGTGESLFSIDGIYDSYNELFKELQIDI